MPHPLYTASVPVFQQFLASTSDMLAKAEAHATARKIEPEALLHSRLFPDMWHTARQVQAVCDFAKGTSPRLAAQAVPSFGDPAPGFAGLQAYIARTQEYIGGLAPELFDGSESRPVSFMAGPNELKFPDGASYLQRFALPNFFFHATTAYGLLRQGGVELAKFDYLGKFV